MLLLFLAFNVSAEGDSLPKEGLSELVFNVKAVNIEGKDISTDKVPDQRVVFNFPIISGGIFGMPKEDRSIELFVTDEKNQIHFDLNNVTNKFAKKSKKLLDVFRELGLKTKSKRTKVARLGSFAYHMEDPKYAKGTWFTKPNNDDMLILAYFDRKTTLTGDATIGDEVYKHNVSVPKKGFYWLESVEVEKGVFEISRCENFSEVDLVVRIDP